MKKTIDVSKILNEGINQSLLKTINFLPSSIDEDTSLFYEEKDCLIYGNLVDCMLTDPDNFDNRFYLDELTEKPPAAIMSFIHELVSLGVKGFNEDVIKEFIDKLDYQKNWNLDTKVNYLLNKCTASQYFDMVIKSEGKQIITQEELSISKIVSDNLCNHIHTTQYFKSENFEQQKLLSGTWGKFKVFGTLDRYNIDPWNKVITPFDIKTTSDYTTNFSKSFKRFKYYYQSIIYTELLKQNYPDYKIEPFRFLVESIKYPGLPLVYCLNEKSTEIALTKVQESFDLLEWHIDNNVWDVPKDIYINNGSIEIDLE